MKPYLSQSHPRMQGTLFRGTALQRWSNLRQCLLHSGSCYWCGMDWTCRSNKKKKNYHQSENEGHTHCIKHLIITLFIRGFIPNSSRFNLHVPLWRSFSEMSGYFSLLWKLLYWAERLYKTHSIKLNTSFLDLLRSKKRFVMVSYTVIFRLLHALWC